MQHRGGHVPQAQGPGGTLAGRLGLDGREANVNAGAPAELLEVRGALQSGGRRRGGAGHGGPGPRAAESALVMQAIGPAAELAEEAADVPVVVDAGGVGELAHAVNPSRARRWAGLRSGMRIRMRARARGRAGGRGGGRHPWLPNDTVVRGRHALGWPVCSYKLAAVGWPQRAAPVSPDLKAQVHKLVAGKEPRGRRVRELRDDVTTPVAHKRVVGASYHGSAISAVGRAWGGLVGHHPAVHPTRRPLPVWASLIARTDDLDDAHVGAPQVQAPNSGAAAEAHVPCPARLRAARDAAKASEMLAHDGAEAAE
mmetsp:Transcript_107336/g.303544  ORF Transcript_107336/g.303544 Transcript_107336/m.303544 type:complete len:312 (+) Transcript_107336:846-1781(+)